MRTAYDKIAAGLQDVIAHASGEEGRGMSVLIAWRMMIVQSRQRRRHRSAFTNLRRPSGISARLPDRRRLAGEE